MNGRFIFVEFVIAASELLVDGVTLWSFGFPLEACDTLITNRVSLIFFTFIVFQIVGVLIVNHAQCSIMLDVIVYWWNCIFI